MKSWCSARLWILSAALAARVAQAATGEDPSFVQASQAQIADLSSITATVGPTGVVNYTFAGFHPAITGVVFTGRGAWNPNTKQASERLSFPRGTITSETTCNADPWSEQTTCSRAGKVAASSGAPVDLALLPWGPPIGAMLLSPQAHLKAKAAYANGLLNRPTATPTHTPTPRLVVKTAKSSESAIVKLTPTRAASLGRAGVPAESGLAIRPAVQGTAPTPTFTPTRQPTHTPTPTSTPTSVPRANPPVPQAGTTARLPLSAVAAMLNEVLQGTIVRLHNAAPGGGYVNDSYVAPGPRLGGGRIPIGIPAATIQAGGTSTLYVNDVNSTGIAVGLAGDRFLVTVTFESAGPELLVRGAIPVDVEADNGRLLLTLTPGLDASGRPSFSTLDADMTATIHCTAPSVITAGICNSIQPFAANFLRNQAAQGFKQTLQTPDFRGRIGAALRALLDAPSGKAAIEKSTGQKIGTIKATRFEAGVLAIDHD